MRRTSPARPRVPWPGTKLFSRKAWPVPSWRPTWEQRTCARASGASRRCTSNVRCSSTPPTTTRAPTSSSSAGGTSTSWRASRRTGGPRRWRAPSRRCPDPPPRWRWSRSGPWAGACSGQTSCGLERRWAPPRSPASSWRERRHWSRWVRPPRTASPCAARSWSPRRRRRAKVPATAPRATSRSTRALPCASRTRTRAFAA